MNGFSNYSQKAQQLSGIEIANTDNAFKASKHILNCNIGINEGIAITLGDKGVVWQSKNLDLHFHVKPIKVNVVDTAVQYYVSMLFWNRLSFIFFDIFGFEGAGDAFVGAFAHYLRKLGMPNIKKVVEIANEYASLTVQQKGTQTSYPRIDDLDASFRI